MSTDFLEILRYQTSYKSVGPNCCLRADRRSDLKKLIVAFHNFAKVTKNLRDFKSLSYVHIFMSVLVTVAVELRSQTKPLALLGNGRTAECLVIVLWIIMLFQHI